MRRTAWLLLPFALTGCVSAPPAAGPDAPSDGLTAVSADRLTSSSDGQPEMSEPLPGAETPETETPETETPASILRAWDAERAAAYATGSVVRLRALYTPGSRAGEDDVRLLQKYLDRGLRVIDMRTQVFRIEVIGGDLEDPGSQDELRLHVTDRLVGARVVGAGSPTPLPRDRASTTEVVLRRIAGQWLVDEVVSRA